MIKKLIAVAATLALLLVFALPAGAVMFGEPDGNNHPYIGLVVFYDEGGVPRWRCSGTLLEPTVFLTAGHCTDGAARAQVWFQEKAAGTGYPFTGGTWGTPHTHPDFQFVLPNTSDVGVVVLDQAAPVTTYGQLAPLGFIEEWAAAPGVEHVDLVGYGLQGVIPDFSAEVARYAGDGFVKPAFNSALTDGFNIQVSSDPGEGNGSGGLCFGDSGGPVLVDGTNVVIAVNSFVLNSYCMGNGFSYRTDIANAQDFILPFLGQ
jgi:hypothetical protein